MNPAKADAGPAAAEVLAIRGLGKTFPGVIALDDVSLSLAPGRVHAVIGQNGAGKSTLINILSGMQQPDTGEIRVDGRPVAIRDTWHALELGIATVYQELSLLPNLTVAQNIALGREPRHLALLDRRAMQENALGALDRLGLALAPDTPVLRLSLAERQMVEIAKALAVRPKVLVLDEPTAPLGAAECEQLFQSVARLKAQGVAILYVSHRFAEILRICDEATVLRNGRHIVTTGLAGWSESRLTEAMIGAKGAQFRRQQRQVGPTKLRASELSWGKRVRSVSLEVRRGEILALTGLLGAGQNEIGRLLGGDLAAERGEIEVSARPVRFLSPHDAVKAGICLLTEERKTEGIFPNRALRENIAIASLPRLRNALGLVRSSAERRDTAREAADFGVVAASLEAPIRTLSGGNQQKSLLARWDLADAEIFVLIEPTRGVDVGARADIYRRLDGLARAGKAIVVVSSDLAEVLAIADRILVVRDGCIAAETAGDELREEDLNLLVQGAAAA